MDNFSFYNPTRIEFGADKEKLIGQILAEQKVSKVLLAFGSDRIKRDGLFSTISDSLTKHGIQYVEFGGIVSNPLISKVREGIQLARAHQVDAILSVGGGSVLDSAKSVAAGTLYDNDVWDLFIGKGQIEAALPVFSVLTLAATGSEMNGGAVVTNDATLEKFALHSVHTFPKVSVVNPALMQTVSRDYLVYSAADIIAHSIEGYFTAAVQPKIQSRLVESVIATVMETTEMLLADAGDYNARAEFAWAATLALNGLTYAGTSGFSYPNHMIEHSLSALFNVPHGAGLSVVMPAWMKWYHSQNPSQFERFAQHLFGLKTAEQGILALEKWFDKIGTPTRLSQLGITEADFPRILENLEGNTRWFGLAETYTPDVLTTILKLAL
ncbi:TPA: iron-containing alcohol dehydrogenase [Escherichia coli]|uniref:iron-containing alcohol dehydrogenase n=1 Tax=Escherichia coli TaxID=562 RepID=UPI001100B2F6|nr:iron-containing alcohol dehydrogenase [Escherichia coli]EEZ8782626.1 iron-containing alcohol dehydrogenase [Escherichia coli O120]EFN7278930.1 iron-containing alcohol dehydrogenase [Escherichia coli O11:H5]EEZ6654608.1 iron-containing alcohol dehydrogenase [Escherichia coli]EFD7764165.1 iron-containing alcohol dehydrogenase [Escherichia coli]EFI9543958.1 iron-containing alcohol dehydrogenase [Escherichia coli]